jgi:glutamate synthase (NADPH/NADH) large chain
MPAPWEIGLAETQQTLLLNNLRAASACRPMAACAPVATWRLRAAGRRRVRLRHRAADRGGLHHDAQVPPQHLPGGRRHAGPGAARRFTGQPEHVINYFFFVAEELRAIMAEMGFRTVAEMVGRVDRLDMKKAIKLEGAGRRSRASCCTGAAG